MWHLFPSRPVCWPTCSAKPPTHFKIGFTDQNEACQKWNYVHNRRFHNNPDFQKNYCTKYRPLRPNKYKCYPIDQNRVGSCDNHVSNIKDIEEQYNKYIYPKPCEDIEKEWIEKNYIVVEQILKNIKYEII